MRDEPQARDSLPQDAHRIPGTLDQALDFIATLVLAGTGAGAGLIVGYILAIVLGLAQFNC